MIPRKYAISGALVGLALVLSSFGTLCFWKKQGIRGTVVRVSGNQMPSPDRPPATPQGFETTLYIYEKTTLEQVDQEKGSAFYRSVKTKLVKTVKSDKKGRFKIKLEPGTYSVFTKKDDLFYANTFDQDNIIAPVAVAKGKFSVITVKVDYDAVY